MFPSYLIIHENILTRKKYISDFIKKLSIHSIDLSIYEESSITIANIRSFQMWAHNKPYASKYKAAIFNADNISSDASQAMLKIIEEPPKNNFIFLHTINKDLVLPTITSRCQIINLPPLEIKITNDEQTKLINFWINIQSAKIGERLKNTIKITTDREIYKNWIDKQIFFFRNELINYYIKPQNKNNFSIQKIYIILKNLNKSLQLNKKNISLKLNCDHLFLHCFETKFHV
jgi:hypothetical protein